MPFIADIIRPSFAVTRSCPGVDGHIAILPGQLRVTAKLGLMMSAMKGTIEEKLRSYLDEEFGRD